MEREMSMIEKRVESMEEELARIDQLTEDPLSHPFRSVKRESVKTNEATPPEVQALQVGKGEEREEREKREKRGRRGTEEREEDRER